MAAPAAPIDIVLARSQMAMSLGFHIVFACAGVAMPVLMVIADVLHRRTGARDYFHLARTWAKGTAVLFAVGAVSGTVLSFELGLLFPGFMRHAGPVIGMPFSLEGAAFFTEAIFLGIYLYGRDRVRPALHIGAGVIVALSGLASAAFVTIANGWMNAPRGFRAVTDAAGRMSFVDVDPIAALGTPAAPHEVVHMALAAYMATAFAAAAIHAWALLRGRGSRALHGRALGIALAVAVPTALAQPLVGHWSGQAVAQQQPAKLAAIERLERTQAYAPLHVGPVAIPGALSVLAFNRPSAVVRGLEEWPPDERPPSIVRPAFQAMVLIGTLLAALSAWVVVRRLRRRAITGDHGRRLLQALVLAGPLGFVAVEAGWVVTEVGRQPWIIYGVMRTSAAVTPMPGLVAPFLVFTLVYIGLAVTVALVLVRHVRATTSDGSEAATAPAVSDAAAAGEATTTGDAAAATDAATPSDAAAATDVAAATDAATRSDAAAATDAATPTEAASHDARGAIRSVR